MLSDTPSLMDSCLFLAISDYCYWSSKLTQVAVTEIRFKTACHFIEEEFSNKLLERQQHWIDKSTWLKSL